MFRKRRPWSFRHRVQNIQCLINQIKNFSITKTIMEKERSTSNWLWRARFFLCCSFFHIVQLKSLDFERSVTEWITLTAMMYHRCWLRRFFFRSVRSFYFFFIFFFGLVSIYKKLHKNIFSIWHGHCAKTIDQIPVNCKPKMKREKKKRQIEIKLAGSLLFTPFWLECV